MFKDMLMTRNKPCGMVTHVHMCPADDVIRYTSGQAGTHEDPCAHDAAGYIHVQMQLAVGNCSSRLTGFADVCATRDLLLYAHCSRRIAWLTAVSCLTAG